MPQVGNVTGVHGTLDCKPTETTKFKKLCPLWKMVAAKISVKQEQQRLDPDSDAATQDALNCPFVGCGEDR